MIEYATRDTGAGQFRIRGDYTKLTKYEQQGLATTDLIQRNGNPEERYTVTLDWRLGGFNANLSMRYIGEFYDSSLTQSTSIEGPGIVVGSTKYWRVEDWTVYNLTARYDFGERNDTLSGLALAAGIRNLTDEDPPFADESFGYRRQLHNSYGRVFWARVDYEF